MDNLSSFCNYYYSSTYIPLYYYEEKYLVFCHPPVEHNILPPDKYLDLLRTSHKTIAYVPTEANAYYGLVRIDNTDAELVIGPVNAIPYTLDVLAKMARDFAFIKEDRERFSIFFNTIPTQNIYNFGNTLLYLNYLINNTVLSRNQIDYDNTVNATDINTMFSADAYTSKEEGKFNDNFAIEQELVHYIETGNIKRLDEFSKRAEGTKIGVLANDTLRHLKNIFIVTVTLASRAAMKGGLSPSTAYRLSDIYVKQMELLNDTQSILELTQKVQYDFAIRVANSMIPMDVDASLFEIIQYVRNNTNKKITVNEIANRFGYSRPYLSKKFKKNLGFNLSVFILRCKLEEGKDLLAYSKYSISQISSYLSFSSQSHFQKAFKDQYGITPLAYRTSSV